MFIHDFIISVLVPTASSVLTDPGPLCRDQPTTLTCNITGGITLIWNYDADGTMPFQLAIIDLQRNPLPPPDPVVTPDGVAITVSLLMPTDLQLVSQISFVATDSVNGTEISCSGLTPGTVVPAESVTLHVLNGKDFLCWLSIGTL